MKKELLHVTVLHLKNKKVSSVACHILKKESLVFYIAMLAGYYARKKQRYFYTIFCLKIFVSDIIFLNRVITLIYNSVKAFSTTITFTSSYIKKKKKNYTVLRSPFVHKTSREQLGVDESVAEVNIKIGTKTIIIINFVQHLLMRLNTCFFSKILLKKKLWRY
jgi:ribosomal protein S10